MVRPMIDFLERDTDVLDPQRAGCRRADAPVSISNASNDFLRPLRRRPRRE
jgi:hypothetical protein